MWAISKIKAPRRADGFGSCVERRRRRTAVIGFDEVMSRVRRHVLEDENPAAHPSFTGKHVHKGADTDEYSRGAASF